MRRLIAGMGLPLGSLTLSSYSIGTPDPAAPLEAMAAWQSVSLAGGWDIGGPSIELFVLLLAAIPFSIWLFSRSRFAIRRHLR